MRRFRLLVEVRLCIVRLTTVCLFSLSLALFPLLAIKQFRSGTRLLIPLMDGHGAQPYVLWFVWAEKLMMIDIQFARRSMKDRFLREGFSLFHPAARKACAGRHLVDVGMRDGRTVSPHRSSQMSSLQARALLFRRAHRLVLRIVFRGIGRRRTLLNIESNSKWFLICQPHSHHLFAGRQGWLDVTISRSLSRQCFCIDRRSTPSNAISCRRLSFRTLHVS